MLFIMMVIFIVIVIVVLVVCMLVIDVISTALIFLASSIHTTIPVGAGGAATAFGTD